MLTQWSRHTATESEVSDVYVRLGYEFNIACRAFTSIGVETADLGPVPDLLRAILEDTLSQEASPASLDKFLPRIRDIIINLLHGLKRKQQKLRSKQAREYPSGGSGLGARQLSTSSTGSGDTGLTQMLEDVPPHRPTSRISERRIGSGTNLPGDEPGMPPRSSSTQNTVPQSVRDETGFESRDYIDRTMQREGRPLPTSLSDSSLSSTTMQELPILSPEEYRLPIQRMSIHGTNDQSQYPAPPPPPKQQDALAALQRGGDLERRASRRYSAYQISKHLGAPPGGVSVLPPAQNSPIPNRGKDVRESLNAVRTRSSLLPKRQRSTNRYGEHSPSRGTVIPRKISEESSQGHEATVTKQEYMAQEHETSPIAKTPQDKSGPSFSDRTGDDRPAMVATLNGPPTDGVNGISAYDVRPTQKHYKHDQDFSTKPSHPEDARALESNTGQRHPVVHQAGEQFVAEQSPQPDKELTLFLQYKSKIKKFVLPDGSNDLSIARLQLAFIEKFAWNTHSNGNDLPEIYIQDSVSGVRHELEDLSDIKDRSVLVLNVEVLDEVKKHIDEGLGGLRRMVEGVRSVVDGQQSAIQQVSDRQQDTATQLSQIATSSPHPTSRAMSNERHAVNGVRTATPSTSTTNQVSEIRSLRRDLAVVRQTFTSFASSVSSSMAGIRNKASSIKAAVVEATVPAIDGDSGRAYVNNGKKMVGEESENIVNRVDDLQDLVEDLRKDVVSRGVRPLPRQLETVSKDISLATAELKKMQEYVKREKPVWTKIWEKELELVCNDREFLTMQEELVADLEDDLEKATQTFALVEEATKQQNLQSATGSTSVTLRSTSRGLVGLDQDVDPAKAKDGVLGEVRALQPNHETRLEAIERAERARQKELESRREGAFKRELGNFVEEGKLKKSGGVEEAERLRKAKDEKNRREGWENQQARQSNKGKEVERPEGTERDPLRADVLTAPEPEDSDVQDSSGTVTDAALVASSGLG